MRFDPIKAGTIIGVSLYFNPIVEPETRQRFEIVVWRNHNGMPGKELTAQRCDPPKEYDPEKPYTFYLLDVPIGFSEPLFVGLRQTKADHIQLGIDLHTPAPSPIVYRSMSAWEPSQYEGALMIRLTCLPYGTTPNPISTPVEIEEGHDISISPNPATHVVKIAGAPLASHLQFYTLQGQLLSTTPLTAEEQLCDIGALPKGLYLAVIVAPSGQRVYAKPLLVQ